MSESLQELESIVTATGEQMPETWAITTLGRIGKWTSGGTPSRSEKRYWNGTIPWIKTGELLDGPITGAEEFITTAGVENSSAKVFPAGTLLMAMYGATIGKLGILTIPAATNQACAALLPSESSLVDRSFLFQYLKSKRAAFRTIGQGGAQPNISQTIIKDFPLPLPPLPEQRRIVAKIETLTAKSRRAKAALEAIPPLIEKFKQSVLAAAFRGDLTAEWRKQHPDVEPASELLKRIRIERRQKWEEAELAKMKAAGKAPKDDRWKEKYKEPEPVDTEGLPELPEGWVWTSLESLTDESRGITYGVVQTGEPDPAGVPTVRCGDIKNFKIDVASLKRVNPAIEEQFKRTRLRGGEVLIAIRGTVGATAVVPSEMKKMNISREVAVLPRLEGIDGGFMALFLASSVGQRFLLDNTKGVAQLGINIGDLRRCPIPVTSIGEQSAVSAAVALQLNGTKQALSRCQATESLIAQIDQSILAKAFRGELVPQDPNDEPASVTLERIKAQGSAVNGTRSLRRSTKRSRSSLASDED